MPLILGTNSIKDTGFDVANSLRFNDPSGDHLSRTPSSASNRKTFTISFWTKICKFDTTGYTIIGAGNSSSGEDGELVLKIDNFGKDGQLILQTGPSVIFETTQSLRDVSAWYHIVVSVDTTNGTSGDRVRLYINGSEVTDFDAENQPSQDQDFAMNNNVVHEIGRFPRITSQEFDGYLAEFVLIDGQQLAPTSFGEFDSDSPNIWKPIDVSGLTFGTNGFYLDFENASSLGADVSGNSNNFTVNNLTSVDQSTDTCTNNFATLNPLHPGATLYTNCIFSDGNLEFESNETGYLVYPIARSTIGVSSGKWYAEFKLLEANAMMGISDGISNENFIGGSTSNGVAYQTDGQKRIANSQTSYGDSYTANDIIGIAMDLDNNRVFFSKNGTFQNSGDPTSSTGALTIPSSSTGVFHFATLDTSSSGTSKVTANFGSPAFSISSGNSDANGHGNFEYAVPSGYFALCTKNLAEFG